MTKPEYVKFRCCMCPQEDKESRTCPGIPHTPHPEPSRCRFVKRYADVRGWRYFVKRRSEHMYRAYCLRLGAGATCAYVGTLSWRETFDEAQTDLNSYAERKGWMEA